MWTSADESYETLDNYSLSDINLADVQDYQNFYAQVNHLPEVAKQDYMLFLKDHGLYRLDRKDNKFKISRALLLLFGKYNSIVGAYPSFMLDFIVKEHEQDVDYQYRICTSFFKGDANNIWSFFRLVMEKSNELVRGEKRLNADETLKAVKEALVNCLVHADYHSRMAVQILWSKERIIFKNPGELLIDQESFFRGTDSKPRNSLLFQTFVQARLGDHAGSGGYRVLVAARRMKVRNPELESAEKATRVIFWLVGKSNSVGRKPAARQQRQCLIAKAVGSLVFRNYHKNE